MRQRIPIYQVDAFTDHLFGGNPAAVCITDDWLADGMMQNIAAENNLSETAFVVPLGSDYGLRWFTPETEVDLCGHATLAAAYVIFHFYDAAAQSISFHSRNSGILNVKRQDDLLTLDFPADDIQRCDPPAVLSGAFSAIPEEVWRGKFDYMIVFASLHEIESARPDMKLLSQVQARGIIITAPGTETDFVSRFFAPLSGVPEDPVTGSAHTSLTPYWSSRLNKTELTAVQLSKRKGYLTCRMGTDRVEISGRAQIYLTGKIFTGNS